MANLTSAQLEELKSLALELARKAGFKGQSAEDFAQDLLKSSFSKTDPRTYMLGIWKRRAITHRQKESGSKPEPKIRAARKSAPREKESRVAAKPKISAVQRAEILAWHQALLSVQVQFGHGLLIGPKKEEAIADLFISFFNAIVDGRHRDGKRVTRYPSAFGPPDLPEDFKSQVCAEGRKLLATPTQGGRWVESSLLPPPPAPRGRPLEVSENAKTRWRNLRERQLRALFEFAIRRSIAKSATAKAALASVLAAERTRVKLAKTRKNARLVKVFRRELQKKR